MFMLFVKAFAPTSSEFLSCLMGRIGLFSSTSSLVHERLLCTVAVGWDWRVK
jgi:hypothetical protein